MTARRPHGTGSVYYDAPRDRWVGSIEAGFTARGTRRRRRVVGKTKQDVRRKIRDAMSEAVADESPIVGGKPTVRTWAEVWLTHTQHTLRPSTWATNRSAVRVWIIPTVGHRRLDQLGPSDVRAVTRAVIAAGRATSTAKRAQAVLEWMLKDAILEGHTVPQRALMLTGPSAGEHDRDAIPLDDASAILNASAGMADRSRWVAAFLQGMRPAECLGLTWRCVDFEAGLIDVSWQLQALPYNVLRDRSSGFRTPDGYEVRQLDGALHLVRPKTSSGQRLIPLVPWMAAALIEWRAVAPKSRHGLVWPRADGRPRTDHDDRAAWVELTDAARVARVDDDRGRRYALYEARHSTATLLRSGGVDDQTITAIMGHATILSTSAYLHTSTSKARTALEALATNLGLGSPPVTG